MELTCDLHIHSHFSRATSRDLDLPHLYQWAQRKGIDIVGTGDFTHPGWRDELRSQLVPSTVSGTEEPGFFELRPELRQALDVEIPRRCRRPVRFVLTAEVSHIFKKDGAVRKVHNLALVPNLETADALCERLVRLGCNITSDGRPIFGLPCRDFLALTLESHPLSYLIPAHIWTPHFSVFGSLSGFDTLEACFGDLTPHLFALETGLSSDPAMNHRISMLDRFTLVSSSDAHSPAKLGRELNRVDLGSEPTFAGLRAAIEHCAAERFLGTIEFYPEEGKYHLDGHRDCHVRLSPQERERLGGRCPRCERPVTVGVLSRVQALADRAADDPFRPARARPFISLVPLTEVLAQVLGVSAAAESVQRTYFRLLDQLGSELHILRAAEPEELRRCGPELLGEAILRVRSGRLQLHGGYDGEYGTLRIFEPSERPRPAERNQMSLFA